MSTDDDLRLSVVVPAYREGPRIATTVKELRTALHDVAEDGEAEIVVVDDGSPDDTAEQARAAGADQVVVLPRNRGKGAAVRAGVAAARGRTIAFTDADLSYSPDQLLPLLAAVEAGGEMVAGSRRHVDTVTLVRARRGREVSGRVFTVITRVLLLGEDRDTQCGLKAFRADVARDLFGRGRVEGFAFDVELFLIARRRGYRVTEVPVAVTNVDTTTVRVGSDALRMVRDLVAMRRRARRGDYD